MNYKQRYLVEILLFVLLGVAALFVYQFSANKYDEQINYINVFVPAEDIPAYSIITKDMLEQKAYAGIVYDDGTFEGDIENIIGKLTVGKLAVEAPIPASMIVNADEYRYGDASLDIISIPISPKYAVGGNINSGEYVDIYLGQINEVEGHIPTASSQHLGQVLVVSPLANDGRVTGYYENREDGDPVIEYQGTEILLVAVPPSSTPNLVQALTLVEKSDEYMMWIILADTPGLKSNALNSVDPVQSEEIQTEAPTE